MLSAILLVGCARPIDIYINADENLNPDQNQRSLPVQMRFYQLTDKDKFLRAGFHELWTEDSKTLGTGLLAKKAATIAPGSKTKVSMQRKKNCRYLGIVAIFRKPQNHSWRKLAKVPKALPGLALSLQLKLQGSGIYGKNNLG